MSLEVIATIPAAPGAADRVIALLQGVSEFSKASEPGVLRYEITTCLNEKTKNTDIIMIEKYKDQEAFDAHVAGETFKALVKALKDEKLLASEFEIRVAKKVGGFSSRL